MFIVLIYNCEMAVASLQILYARSIYQVFALGYKPLPNLIIAPAGT